MCVCVCVCVSSYKYLKKKKSTKGCLGKKKSVATMPIEQTKEAQFADWCFLYIEICFVSIIIYMSAHINI